MVEVLILLVGMLNIVPCLRQFMMTPVCTDTLLLPCSKTTYFIDIKQNFFFWQNIGIQNAVIYLVTLLL